MVRFFKGKLLVSVLAVALTLSLTYGAVAAADRTTALFDRIRTVYNVVADWHKDGADLDRFVDGAIRGGLAALGDPYTNFFTPQEFSDFFESLDGQFTGIGAYLELDGSYIVIASPIKNSPAAKAGLQSGDRILEADGTSLVGATTDKAVSLIRGPEGTDVVLKIERPSENRTFTITITRALVTIPQVESEMLDGEVGYIQLSTFGGSSAKEFYKAVEQLKAQGAKALVLDLRQNGGGYLDQAIDIASAFVPNGEPVVWEIDKESKFSQRSSGRLIDLPTSVLVDGGSASASEILAGAIQDYGAAPLVGVKTFGKGTVQQLLTIGTAGGMKVTTAEYLTPKERHVHGIGLTPDYEVVNPKPDPERVKPMEFTRLLTQGEVGLDVLYLQYRLQDLGYDPDVHGLFGGKTARAVVAFALDNGLAQEPGVDAKFIEVLNRKVAARSQTAKQDDLQLAKAVELVRAKLK